MPEPGSPEELESLVNSAEWEVRGRALMAAAAACSGMSDFSGYSFAAAIRQAEKYLRTGNARG